ncbi:putative quinol monooxygenase [Agrobacterium pusense]|uniref:putative quinol monooxygenase n=1 Tax=Agrobacterium pusense TaxID=648995 RepID=UPI002FDCB680
MPCMNNRAGAVRLRGFLRCLSKDDVELVRRHLPEHLRLTREEPGCISFEVSETDDPLIWRVEELFADRAAFDFHQQRTRASEWFMGTSVIPRDYEITTLE